MQTRAYEPGLYAGGTTRNAAQSLWRRLCAVVVAVDRTLAVWHYRVRSRRELARLEAWVLRDAGLDPIDVGREANKPFWRA